MLDHVRDTIIEYLAGRFSADDLATRLPDGWEIDDAGTPEARTLTLKAIGYLAEYQCGDRTEDNLWRALSALVARKSATPGSRTPTYYVAETRTQLSAGAGKRPQVASV
jgi:hypothetical protein